MRYILSYLRLFQNMVILESSISLENIVYPPFLRAEINDHLLSRAGIKMINQLP